MAKKEKIVVTKAKKKTAIARARIRKKKLKDGSVKVRVNQKSLAVYSNELARKEIAYPITIATDVLGDKAINELDINVNVRGGGFMSQAEASKGAIAKALVEWTGKEELKKAYLEKDRQLLVDDVRRKESKKYMRKGARARYQKSYR